MKKPILFLLTLLALSFLHVQGEEDSSAVVSDDSSVIQLNDSLSLQMLNYDTTGSVDLGSGLATFAIPVGFKYLNPAQSSYVLADLWGNPPSETNGMIFPADASPIYPATWAIEILYEEDGHVKDDDAKDIDYDDLLEEMQEQVKEINPQRKEAGYSTVELLGWASPPYYDEHTKKLHWAKRLQFENDSTETLNYNIRVLGRKGVLVLNAIGGMDQLYEIKTNIDAILASVNFTEGNRYEDFDESNDKIAAYGVGGLIAGGILAKTGLFAKIGLLFAKFAKVFIIGGIAAGGAIIRLFSGRKKDEGQA